MAFRAGNAEQSGIYLFNETILSTVADTNTPIPGGSGNFTSFSAPVISNGNVAFTAFGTGQQQGIYLFNGTTLSKVADTNTPIPGGSGNFGGFSDPVINDGKVAFGAAGAGQQGFYLATSQAHPVDFDGDGATDVAAFHLPSDQFFTDYAGTLGQYGWGGADCYPLVWDYDGDGRTDVSVYHIPTNQWLVKGVPGDNLGQFGWGGEDSVPVPGDYNGDGVMDRAFYHWPTNRWFVEGTGGSFTAYAFGWGGADSIPVPGDYDGDGTTDIAIYHVPSNQWIWRDKNGTDHFLGQFGWGGADSIPVPGDYDGDGATDIAIYHVPSNQWVWRDKSGTPHFLGQYGWGGMASFPIPGDYNGDGVMEIAIYRPSENRWFIDGEPEFVWGWDGANFMPITSQMAIYNWFRFVLGKFE